MIKFGWESLPNRRWFRRLVQFFKIKNNLTPEYLKIPIPSYREYAINTRSGNQTPLIDAKRDYYKNSFYPDAIKSWNELDSNLRQETSISRFKSNILKIIRPLKKSIFDIHDPRGIKILYQLRVGLSPLRHHKKCHNFEDTPTDTCRCQADSETTAHFLFICNLYTEVRNNLLQVIIPLFESRSLVFRNDTLREKFCLYGHDTFSFDENKAVINATLKYIHDSRRFELLNDEV